MATPIRTFLAIQPPHEIRGRLVDEQAKFDASGVDLRPVPRQNIHLTIEFLGSIPADSVPGLADLMDQIGSRLPRFDLEINGISPFPSRRPAVIAAEIAQSTNLDRLVTTIRDRLSVAGFEAETRPFRPHITLARIKGGHRRVRGRSRPLDYAFTVEEVVLFRSDLSPDGARYSRLHETKLTG